MPHLLPEKDLLSLIENNIIQFGIKENAEGIKYDFTLGTKILKAKYKTPVEYSELNVSERADFFVEPGEVVFVLSQERLSLPNDIYVILVPKRKLSHEGILILGGLSVDPYYDGRLLIGVYNFSSSRFPLIPGKKIIGAHFYKLREDEVDNTHTKPNVSIDEFPDELIRLMEKYTPISSQSLLDKVNNIDTKLEEFKKEFRNRENWFDRFQSKLDEQEKLVGDLLSGLREERVNRTNSDKELDNEIKNFRDELKQHSQRSFINSIWIKIIEAILMGVIIGVIVYAIQGGFNSKNQNNLLPQTRVASPNSHIDSATMHK